MPMLGLVYHQITYPWKKTGFHACTAFTGTLGLTFLKMMWKN